MVPTFFKGRQGRTRKSTQQAAPRTQQTSSQTPATQSHLPAPSPQVLHQLAPGCTSFFVCRVVLDAVGGEAGVLYICVRLELTPPDLKMPWIEEMFVRFELLKTMAMESIYGSRELMVVLRREKSHVVDIHPKYPIERL